MCFPAINLQSHLMLSTNQRLVLKLFPSVVPDTLGSGHSYGTFEQRFEFPSGRNEARLEHTVFLNTPTIRQ